MRVPNLKSSNLAASVILGSFSHDSRSGLAHVLGVFEPNVCAKHFIESFSGFDLRTLCICHNLFDADDLVTCGALAEAMTGVIHFYPRSKPIHIGQFWCSHCSQFPVDHSSTHGRTSAIWMEDLAGESERFLKLGQLFSSACGTRLYVRPKFVHHGPELFGILRSVGHPARQCADIFFGRHTSRESICSSFCLKT